MEYCNSETKYEDEPMNVSEEPDTYYHEEGEINSSDEEKNVNDQLLLSVPNVFEKDNHSGRNVFDKNEAQKKLDRAKRFFLPLETNASAVEPHQEKFSDLYRDLGIDKENERHYRFNTLHMRGTENMSTDDVLRYFVTHAPSHVEWINDVSCNIVWLDDVSAARALINLSRKIKNLDKVHLNADPFEMDFKRDSLNKEKKNSDNDDDDDDDNNDKDTVDAKKIKVAIPPGVWRIGVPCEKNSFILLRFATRSDKKHKNAEKNSEYYKKYGNPHYGNIPGLISNTLRSGVKKSKNKEFNFTINSNKYVKEKLDKNNPWEELAYEWGKTDKVEDTQNYIGSSIAQKKTQIPDLRISLSNKKEKAKGFVKDLKTSSKALERGTKIKIPRMKMYADDEEKKQKKKFEKRYQIRPLKRHEEDLRSKIIMKKSKPRFKFRSEKIFQDVLSGESSTSDNENESNKRALDSYCDLRQSLGKNKTKYSRYKIVNYESESESDDFMKDNLYELSINQQSPLQIEIENEDYCTNDL